MGFLSLIVQVLATLFLSSWLLRNIWNGIAWTIAFLISLVVSGFHVARALCRDYPAVSAEIGWNAALLLAGGYVGPHVGLTSWASWLIISAPCWVTVSWLAFAHPSSNKPSSNQPSKSRLNQLIETRGGLRLVLLRSAVLMTAIGVINSPAVPIITTEIGEKYLEVTNHFQALKSEEGE
jgi:hypothetical protein